MEAEQESTEDVHYVEDISQAEAKQEQQVTEQEQVITEETQEQKKGNPARNNHSGGRGNFVHGLSVGLGIGCIATFVIIWVTLFFTPQLPMAITYENMLSVFIYPLIYLLTVGLIALTAGIVREYYVARP
jgi:tetrahydromethanopterin S-methyltransferase subunit B